MIMATPRAATVQNDTRQPDSCRITAPSSGPTIGAMPPTAAITFRTRTSWAPRARSMITARPMTMAQPPAKPCTQPGPGQDRDGGGQRTHHRRDRHGHDPGQQRHPAAALVGDRAADELAEGHADEERGQRQLHLGGGRGQVGRDRGERRHVHVGGQRCDRGQEHDRRDHGGTDLRPACRWVRTGCGWSPRYSQSGQWPRWSMVGRDSVTVLAAPWWLVVRPWPGSRRPHQRAAR